MYCLIKKFSWDSYELKQIWKCLYLNNKFLTPYSSWEYNDIVHKYVKIKPQTLFRTNYFYVYYENNTPLMIFPFQKKHDYLILFGEGISGAEYLDFIYDENITDNQILNALRELRVYHSSTELRLYKINEISKIYRFFHNNVVNLATEFNLSETYDRICKRIEFSNDYDEYFAGLTKNSKSNLKKAYNKLDKNGIEYEIKFSLGILKDKNLLREIFKIYTKRSEEWMKKHRSFPFAKYIKNRYFSVTAWSMQNMDSHCTFCFFLDRKLAAFMTGYLTNYNEITFPMISMNSEYAKFSPGKIMISEAVKYLQQNTNIHALDVSRGDERYKVEMGGHSHYNYRYRLSL